MLHEGSIAPVPLVMHAAWNSWILSFYSHGCAPAFLGIPRCQSLCAVL